MKKKYKKMASTVLFTIILAIISSALWDILKPLFNKSTDFFFSVVTLGIDKIQDSIYLDVAKGFHENISLEMYAIVISFIMGIPFGLTFIILFSKTHKQVIHNLAEGIRKKKRSAKILLSLYTLFFVTISLFQFGKINYTNKYITKYNQSLQIISPYIAEYDKLIIQSNFSQIKNKQDYEGIMFRLKDIAKRNNLSLD